MYFIVGELIYAEMQLRLALPKIKRAKKRGRPRGKLVPHAQRERFPGRFPVHVTLRMADWVFHLRSKRCYTVIRRAVFNAHRTFFRIVDFSVQGNHLHLICEADDEKSLARGIQGLNIRIAKGLNKVMGRQGKVFAGRYHVHVLRKPHETHNAVRYAVDNYRKHAAQRGELLPPSWVDPYSSDHDRIVCACCRSVFRRCESAAANFELCHACGEATWYPPEHHFDIGGEG